jgi:hypothetical protein
VRHDCAEMLAQGLWNGVATSIHREGGSRRTAVPWAKAPNADLPHP